MGSVASAVSVTVRNAMLEQTAENGLKAGMIPRRNVGGRNRNPSRNRARVRYRCGRGKMRRFGVGVPCVPSAKIGSLFLQQRLQPLDVHIAHAAPVFYSQAGGGPGRLTRDEGRADEPGPVEHHVVGCDAAAGCQ